MGVHKETNVLSEGASGLAAPDGPPRQSDALRALSRPSSGMSRSAADRPAVRIDHPLVRDLVRDLLLAGTITTDDILAAATEEGVDHDPAAGWQMVVQRLMVILAARGWTCHGPAAPRLLALIGPAARARRRPPARGARRPDERKIAKAQPAANSGAPSAETPKNFVSLPTPDNTAARTQLKDARKLVRWATRVWRACRESSPRCAWASPAAASEARRLAVALALLLYEVRAALLDRGPEQGV